jgi:hypothetical protein
MNSRCTTDKREREKKDQREVTEKKITTTWI